MQFVYSLVPVSAVCTSLLLGGGCFAGVAVLVSVCACAASLRTRSRFGGVLFASLCIGSVTLRLGAVFLSSRDTVGAVSSAALVLLCIAAAVYSVWRRAFFLLAPPVAFFSFAVCIYALTAFSASASAAPGVSAAGAAASVVTPLAFSGAVARFSSVRGAKRVRFAALGAAACAVLLFCPAAKAELCLLSVPLSVTATAFELYAAADVITRCGGE